MEQVPEQAFEQMVLDTEPFVRSYIAGLGVPSHAVDDVAQNVYVEFYQAGARPPEDVATLQWLKGIARNLTFDHFRKTKRETKHFEKIREILGQTELADDCWVPSEELTKAIQECMARLTDSHRDILTMRHYKEYTARTIAGLIRSTERSVRVRLHRIRVALRQCIATRLEAYNVSES